LVVLAAAYDAADSDGHSTLSQSAVAIPSEGNHDLSGVPEWRKSSLNKHTDCSWNERHRSFDTGWTFSDFLFPACFFSFK
jgi:hypothetical protein